MLFIICFLICLVYGSVPNPHSQYRQQNSDVLDFRMNHADSDEFIFKLETIKLNTLFLTNQQARCLMIENDLKHSVDYVSLHALDLGPEYSEKLKIECNGGKSEPKILMGFNNSIPNATIINYKSEDSAIIMLNAITNSDLHRIVLPGCDVCIGKKAGQSLIEIFMLRIEGDNTPSKAQRTNEVKSPHPFPEIKQGIPMLIVSSISYIPIPYSYSEKTFPKINPEIPAWIINSALQNSEPPQISPRIISNSDFSSKAQRSNEEKAPHPFPKVHQKTPDWIFNSDFHNPVPYSYSENSPRIIGNSDFPSSNPSRSKKKEAPQPVPDFNQDIDLIFNSFSHSTVPNSLGLILATLVLVIFGFLR